jgi:hypothetical protein
MLFSTFGFVCVVVCLVEAAILVVLLEEQLMGEKKSADEPGIAMMLLQNPFGIMQTRMAC